MTLPETISTHVLQNCRKEYIPLCGLYRASIDLNGYTYARVRKTEEQAVADLVSACVKSLKWQRAFGNIPQTYPHRWKENVCVHCALTRKRKYWKLLMAITNHPPYNHYKTGTNWWYGEQHQFTRPQCVRSQ